MKQSSIILVIFLFLTIIALPSKAQMRVTPTGQIRMGYNTDLSHPEEQDIEYDQNASLILIGHTPGNTNSGYMSFGPGSNVLIGESPLYDNVFMIDSGNGIIFRTGRKTVFRYGAFDNIFNSNESPINKFIFSCDVVAPSFNVASDARLKKDINTIEDYGKFLYDLTPVKYRLDNSAFSSEKLKQNVDSFDVRTRMPYDTKERYGFIAQEVQKIYPELVSEDSDGLLTIDYLGFIPLIVDQIKSLKNELNQYKEYYKAQHTPDYTTYLADSSCNISSFESNTYPDKETALYQNQPNPFNINTEISCDIPEYIINAFLIIYDMQGHQLKKHIISERGKTKLTINRDSLSPGMYIYALIADGREVASKRLIVTD